MLNYYEMTFSWGKTLLNTYFDQIYYDVSAVAAAEQEKLPPLGAEPFLLCLDAGGTGGVRIFQSLCQMKAAGQLPTVFAPAGCGFSHPWRRRFRAQPGRRIRDLCLRHRARRSQLWLVRAVSGLALRR